MLTQSPIPQTAPSSITSPQLNDEAIRRSLVAFIAALPRNYPMLRYVMTDFADHSFLDQLLQLNEMKKKYDCPVYFISPELPPVSIRSYRGIDDTAEISLFTSSLEDEPDSFMAMQSTRKTAANELRDLIKDPKKLAYLLPEILDFIKENPFSLLAGHLKRYKNSDIIKLYKEDPNVLDKYFIQMEQDSFCHLGKRSAHLLMSKRGCLLTFWENNPTKSNELTALSLESPFSILSGGVEILERMDLLCLSNGSYRVLHRDRKKLSGQTPLLLDSFQPKKYFFGALLDDTLLLVHPFGEKGLHIFSPYLSFFKDALNIKKTYLSQNHYYPANGNVTHWIATAFMREFSWLQPYILQIKIEENGKQDTVSTAPNFLCAYYKIDLLKAKLMPPRVARITQYGSSGQLDLSPFVLEEQDEMFILRGKKPALEQQLMYEFLEGSLPTKISSTKIMTDMNNLEEKLQEELDDAKSDKIVPNTSYLTKISAVDSKCAYYFEDNSEEKESVDFYAALGLTREKAIQQLKYYRADIVETHTLYQRETLPGCYLFRKPATWAPFTKCTEIRMLTTGSKPDAKKGYLKETIYVCKEEKSGELSAFWIEEKGEFVGHVITKKNQEQLLAPEVEAILKIGISQNHSLFSEVATLCGYKKSGYGKEEEIHPYAYYCVSGKNDFYLRIHSHYFPIDVPLRNVKKLQEECEKLMGDNEYFSLTRQEAMDLIIANINPDYDYLTCFFNKCYFLEKNTLYYLKQKSAPEEVKISDFTKFISGIEAISTHEKCDLLWMPVLPHLDTLSILPIPAYVRSGDHLFYVHGVERQCDEIIISPEQKILFDKKMEPTNRARALSIQELAEITSITGHAPLERGRKSLTNTDVQELITQNGGHIPIRFSELAITPVIPEQGMHTLRLLAFQEIRDYLTAECKHVVLLKPGEEVDAKYSNKKTTIYLRSESNGKPSSKSAYWIEKNQLIAHPIREKNQTALLALLVPITSDLRTGISNKHPDFENIIALCGYPSIPPKLKSIASPLIDNYRKAKEQWKGEKRQLNKYGISSKNISFSKLMLSKVSQSVSGDMPAAISLKNSGTQDNHLEKTLEDKAIIYHTYLQRKRALNAYCMEKETYQAMVDHLAQHATLPFFKEVLAHINGVSFALWKPSSSAAYSWQLDANYAPDLPSSTYHLLEVEQKINAEELPRYQLIADKQVKKVFLDTKQRADIRAGSLSKLQQPMQHLWDSTYFEEAMFAVLQYLKHQTTAVEKAPAYLAWFNILLGPASFYQNQIKHMRHHHIPLDLSLNNNYTKLWKEVEKSVQYLKNKAIWDEILRRNGRHNDGEWARQSEILNLIKKNPGPFKADALVKTQLAFNHAEEKKRIHEQLEASLNHFHETRSDEGSLEWKPKNPEEQDLWQTYWVTYIKEQLDPTKKRDWDSKLQGSTQRLIKQHLSPEDQKAKEQDIKKFIENRLALLSISIGETYRLHLQQKVKKFSKQLQKVPNMATIDLEKSYLHPYWNSYFNFITNTCNQIMNHPMIETYIRSDKLASKLEYDRILMLEDVPVPSPDSNKKTIYLCAGKDGRWSAYFYSVESDKFIGYFLNEENQAALLAIKMDAKLTKGVSSSHACFHLIASLCDYISVSDHIKQVEESSNQLEKIFSQQEMRARLERIEQKQRQHLAILGGQEEVKLEEDRMEDQPEEIIEDSYRAEAEDLLKEHNALIKYYYQAISEKTLVDAVVKTGVGHISQASISDENGNTLLHYMIARYQQALKSGRVKELNAIYELIKRLYDHGASARALNHMEQTPYEFAGIDWQRYTAPKFSEKDTLIAYWRLICLELNSLIIYVQFSREACLLYIDYCEETIATLESFFQRLFIRLEGKWDRLVLMAEALQKLYTASEQLNEESLEEFIKEILDSRYNCIMMLENGTKPNVFENFDKETIYISEANKKLSAYWVEQGQFVAHEITKENESKLLKHRADLIKGISRKDRNFIEIRSSCGYTRKKMYTGIGSRFEKLHKQLNDRKGELPLVKTPSSPSSSPASPPSAKVGSPGKSKASDVSPSYPLVSDGKKVAPFMIPPINLRGEETKPKTISSSTERYLTDNTYALFSDEKELKILYEQKDEITKRITETPEDTRLYNDLREISVRIKKLEHSKQKTPLVEESLTQNNEVLRSPHSSGEASSTSGPATAPSSSEEDAPTTPYLFLR